MNEAFRSQDYESLISDGVHPTDAGYRLYGEVLFAAYKKAVRGDLDGNKVVNAADYSMLKRAVLGSFVLTSFRANRADVKEDGTLNSADYLMLKRAVLRTYEIDRGVPEPLVPTGFTVYADLVPDSREQADMAANTAELQSCVDQVHDAGGGTVVLPSGTFYFATQGMNARQYEDYVCMPKDNVRVMGQGESTVLKPVGNTRGGLDMFYYNEYADSGFRNPVYLVNADFDHFVIDGELAHAARYTSAGKGFMFNLFKDCDFDHVVCKNTDGTGFGVDCPINCTITNCRAYGCGKAGNTSSYGASGFGIGTGYAENESILIKDCYAEGNMKFGFFFEHQGRFSPSAYTAQKLGECVVSDCTARNNYNDFGGELALDLKYVNCTVPADTTSLSPIAFRQHSIRCTLENMDVQLRFKDVQDESLYYYEPVYWAVNKGVTTGQGNNQFGIQAGCTKGQVLTFLYRLAGMPGRLILGNGSEGPFWSDAFAWATETGICSDGEESMNEVCSRTVFITYLWKYAGSPEADGPYDPAVNWAVEAGLMDTVMETDILRRDAITLLYRYFG
ncbi:MAG: S-layer homology domain-containing protein [Clostridia bacterium]|nr:S-layer homology domain-containing protein [Clostridia bacterium]